MSDIAVIGAGAFGTALAVALARAGQNVTLIARSQDHVDAMNASRVNVTRLPGVDLPSSLNVSLTLGSSPDTALFAVPTQRLADFLRAFPPLPDSCPIVACNKGVDLTRGVGATGIIKSVLPNAQTAVLSGPAFAVDIAASLPTAMTLACKDDALGAQLQSRLSTPSIRLYRTQDVIGTELGGALKNVVAIAAGIVVGLGLGESARAAVMARGFAELTRFAAANGAEAETLHGLSGLGDLVLTCTSEKSRNFRYGLALGAGDTGDLNATVEGAATAKIVSKLAKNDEISVPITDVVAAIVSGQMTAQDARALLLARPLREE